jgi:hypothetical protein
MDTNIVETDDKWKINLNDIFNTSDKQFQPEIIIQKLKNVKKKRKKENYKNIEPLENIYEMPDPQGQMLKSVSNQRDLRSNQRDLRSNQPLIEGLTNDPVAHFKPGDYEGGDDDIYEGNTTANTGETNVDIINRFFDSIENVPGRIAHYITKWFSSHNSSTIHADEKTVHKYVSWYIAIVVSTFAVYNWFYILFYKSSGTRVSMFEISRDSVTSKIGPQWRAAEWFLIYSLFYPEMFQKKIINDIPDAISKYLDPKICFILLFCILLNLSYYSTSILRKLCIDISTFNLKDPLLLCMYGSLFILLGLSVFDNIKVGTKFFMMIPYAAILVAISTVLQILFTVFFGVPIAASFIVAMIICLSFFGITIVSGKINPFEVIPSINEYIETNSVHFTKGTSCKPRWWNDNIFIPILNCFNYIYVCVFQLAFIQMFINGIISIFAFKSISNNQLRFVLLALNLFGIIGNVMYIVDAIRKYIKNEKNIEIFKPPTFKASGAGISDAAPDAAQESIAPVAVPVSTTVPDAVPVSTTVPDAVPVSTNAPVSATSSKSVTGSVFDMFKPKHNDYIAPELTSRPQHVTL